MAVLAALAAILLLSGCGHGADPFVGTWQSNTPTARLTIDALSGSGGDYVATLASSRAAADVSLVRHDNELRVTSSQMPNMARAAIDYDPATGQLTLRGAGGPLSPLITQAHFSRVSAGTSDPFGPDEGWVRAAGASGRLSSLNDTLNVLFHTPGGMLRIRGTLTFPSADDMSYSGYGLVQVKPHPGRSDVDIVDSHFMPNTPDNVEVIDEVSAHALAPGLWRYNLSAALVTYKLAFYVKK